MQALAPIPRIILASSCAEMKIGTLLGASSLNRAVAMQWHSCLADQVLPVPECRRDEGGFVSAVVGVSGILQCKTRMCNDRGRLWCVLGVNSE